MAVTQRKEGTTVFDAVNVLGSISQAGNKITASVPEINKAADGIDTSAEARMLQVQSGTVVHTDTVAKDLFTLPATAVLIGFHVFVTEAFDDTGANGGAIGQKGVADDHYIGSMDFGVAALKLPNFENLGSVGANDVVITGKFTGQNGDASQGSATVVALYYMP